MKIQTVRGDPYLLDKSMGDKSAKRGPFFKVANPVGVPGVKSVKGGSPKGISPGHPSRDGEHPTLAGSHHVIP